MDDILQQRLSRSLNNQSGWPTQQKKKSSFKDIISAGQQDKPILAGYNPLGGWDTDTTAVTPPPPKPKVNETSFMDDVWNYGKSMVKTVEDAVTSTEEEKGYVQNVADRLNKAKTSGQRLSQDKTALYYGVATGGQDAGYSKKQQETFNNLVQYGKQLKLNEIEQLVEFGAADYVFNKEKNSIDIVPIKNGAAYTSPLGYIDMYGKYRPYKYTKETQSQSFNPNAPFQYKTNTPITPEEYHKNFQGGRLVNTQIESPLRGIENEQQYQNTGDLYQQGTNALNQPVDISYTEGGNKPRSATDSFLTGLDEGVNILDKVERVFTGASDVNQVRAQQENPDAYGYGKMAGDLASTVAAAVTVAPYGGVVLAGSVGAVISNLERYKQVGQGTLKPGAAGAYTFVEGLSNFMGYGAARRVTTSLINKANKNLKTYSNAAMGLINKLTGGTGFGAASQEVISSTAQNFLGTGFSIAAGTWMLNSAVRSGGIEQQKYTAAELGQMAASEAIFSIGLGAAMDVIPNIASKTLQSRDGATLNAVTSYVGNKYGLNEQGQYQFDLTNSAGVAELLTGAIDYAADNKLNTQDVVKSVVKELYGDNLKGITPEDYAKLFISMKILEDARTAQKVAASMEEKNAPQTTSEGVTVTADKIPQEAGTVEGMPAQVSESPQVRLSNLTEKDKNTHPLSEAIIQQTAGKPEVVKAIKQANGIDVVKDFSKGRTEYFKLVDEFNIPHDQAADAFVPLMTGKYVIPFDDAIAKVNQMLVDNISMQTPSGQSIAHSIKQGIVQKAVEAGGNPALVIGRMNEILGKTSKQVATKLDGQNADQITQSIVKKLSTGEPDETAQFIVKGIMVTAPKAEAVPGKVDEGTPEVPTEDVIPEVPQEITPQEPAAPETPPMSHLRVTDPAETSTPDQLSSETIDIQTNQPAVPKVKTIPEGTETIESAIPYKPDQPMDEGEVPTDVPPTDVPPQPEAINTPEQAIEGEIQHAENVSETISAKEGAVQNINSKIEEIEDTATGTSRQTGSTAYDIGSAPNTQGMKPNVSVPQSKKERAADWRRRREEELIAEQEVVSEIGVDKYTVKQRLANGLDRWIRDDVIDAGILGMQRIPKIIYVDPKTNTIVNYLPDVESNGISPLTADDGTGLFRPVSFDKDLSFTLDQTSSNNLTKTFEALYDYVGKLQVESQFREQTNDVSFLNAAGERDAAMVVIDMLKANPLPFAGLTIEIGKQGPEYNSLSDTITVVDPTRLSKQSVKEVSTLLHEYSHSLFSRLPKEVSDGLYESWHRNRAELYESAFGLWRSYATENGISGDAFAAVAKAMDDVYNSITSSTHTNRVNKYNEFQSKFRALNDELRKYKSDTATQQLNQNILHYMYSAGHPAEYFANEMALWLSRKKGIATPEQNFMQNAPAFIQNGFKYIMSFIDTLKRIAFRKPQDPDYLSSAYDAILSGRTVRKDILFDTEAGESEWGTMVQAGMNGISVKSGDIPDLGVDPNVPLKIQQANFLGIDTKELQKKMANGVRKIFTTDRTKPAEPPVRVSATNIKYSAKGKEYRKVLEESGMSPKEVDIEMSRLANIFQDVLGAYDDVIGVGVGKGVDQERSDIGHIAFKVDLQQQNNFWGLTEEQLAGVLDKVGRISEHSHASANLSPKAITDALTDATVKVNLENNRITKINDDFHKMADRDMQQAIWNVNRIKYRQIKTQEIMAERDPELKMRLQAGLRDEILSPASIRTLLAEELVKANPTKYKDPTAAKIDTDKAYQAFLKFRELNDTLTEQQARLHVEQFTGMDFDYVKGSYAESLLRYKEVDKQIKEIKKELKDFFVASKQQEQAYIAEGKPEDAAKEKADRDNQALLRQDQINTLKDITYEQDKSIVRNYKWYNDFVQGSKDNMYLDEHGDIAQKPQAYTFEPVHWDEETGQWESSTPTSKRGATDKAGIILASETEHDARLMMEDFLKNHNGREYGSLDSDSNPESDMFIMDLYTTDGRPKFDEKGRRVQGVFRRKYKDGSYRPTQTKRETINKLLRAFGGSGAVDRVVLSDALHGLDLEIAGIKEKAEQGLLTAEDAIHAKEIESASRIIRQSFPDLSTVDEGGSSAKQISKAKQASLIRQLTHMLERPSAGLRTHATNLYLNAEWKGWRRATGTGLEEKTAVKAISDNVQNKKTFASYQAERNAFRKAIQEQALTLNEWGLGNTPYYKYLMDLADRAEMMPYSPKDQSTNKYSKGSGSTVAKLMNGLSMATTAKLSLNPVLYVSNRTMNVIANIGYQVSRGDNTGSVIVGQMKSQLSHFPSDFIKLTSRGVGRWNEDAEARMRDWANQYEANLYDDPYIKEAFQLGKDADLMSETTAKNAVDWGRSGPANAMLIFLSVSERQNRRATYVSDLMRYRKQNPPPPAGADGKIDQTYLANMVRSANHAVAMVDGKFNHFHMGAWMTKLNSSPARLALHLVKPMASSLATTKAYYETMGSNLFKKGITDPRTLKNAKAVFAHAAAGTILAGLTNTQVFGDIINTGMFLGNMIMNDEDVSELFYEDTAAKVERWFLEKCKDAGIPESIARWTTLWANNGLLGATFGRRMTTNENVAGVFDNMVLSVANDLRETVGKIGKSKSSTDAMKWIGKFVLEQTIVPPSVKKLANATMWSEAKGQTFDYGEKYYPNMPTGLGDRAAYVLAGKPLAMTKESNDKFRGVNSLTTDTQKEDFMRSVFNRVGITTGWNEAGEKNLAGELKQYAHPLRGEILKQLEAQDLNDGLETSMDAIERYAKDNPEILKRMKMGTSEADTRSYSEDEAKNTLQQYVKDYYEATAIKRAASKVLPQDKIVLGSRLATPDTKLAGYEYAIAKLRTKLIKQQQVRPSRRKR